MKQAPALFALNAEVEALEEEVASLPSPQRLPAQTRLAWLLRERDCGRALALAQQVEQALSPAVCAALPPELLASLRWRLQLTGIEVRRLRGEAAQDEALAAMILQQAEEAGDWISAADACWVSALLTTVGGDMVRCRDLLGHGIELAVRAGDLDRQWLLECSQARYAGLTDRYAAEARWGDRFEHISASLAPASRPLIALYGAYRTMRASKLSEAIQRFSTLIEPLIDAGHVREAITAQVNLGNSFNELNAPEAALEWTERALDLARGQGWRHSTGICQIQLGETLRRLGRLDLAQQQLTEALQSFADLPQSRNYAMGLSYLGRLALDQAQAQEAIDFFARLQALEGFADLQMIALRGQAQALLQLDQLEEAERFAQQALQLAVSRGAGELEVELGLLLARIAQRQPTDRQSLALQYLERARERAKSIAGYQDGADLLNALAMAYADAGRYREAFEASQLAANSRAQTLGREADKRLASIQLRNLSESARAQADYLGQLAEAERQKAQLMQRNSDTLEKLGLIGQELTRQLDLNSIFSALSQHIPSLLDARSFEIYLLDTEGQGLSSVFGLEDGVRLPPDHIALNDPASNAVRCALERSELSVQLAADGSDPSQIPGTMRTLSALFAPLLIGDRLLGVVTVQSPLADAYGEHERMIFRTLNAYTAIALDNANAYQRLQQAQSQLIAQEKLAALGALVAGIAHELNTPLGNSLLMASTLEQRTAEVERAAVAKALRRSELEAFFDEARSMARLIMQGLETAARLITSFKQVAVDQTVEQRRDFDLAGMCEQLVATLRASIRKQGHQITLDIPAGILMNSFPGPFGQVLSNLINNAMLHGFGERRGGQMHLSAQLLKDGRVELRFVDDGLGISPAHAKRIFEPFFTTKFGQGGSGLGLSISHNIVSSLLGGSLTLEPKSGPGACFVVNLPLQAPLRADGGAAQEPGGQSGSAI
ncbi:ATP-binding protein [Paucibacter sp. AS339]|uniref:ATP-binding protein n=1 Tax=Paucibacter hankyongi TaxID=3133434 RepID=UPI0030A9D5DD